MIAARRLDRGAYGPAGEWRDRPFSGPAAPENSLYVIVLLEPVYLGPDVAVDDIALLVLETPWNNDQEIPLADPEPLLDLALDPPGARDTVLAADTDMVCPEHQLRPAKDLLVLLLRQPYAYDLFTLVLPASSWCSCQ